MITRFQRCLGVRLLRLGRWQVELWLCPRGEVIPPHTHQYFDGRLVFLAGSMLWTLAGQTREVGWRDVLRCWRVPAGTNHGATVTGRFGVFLNIEQWQGVPSSAATDFIPAP